MSKFLYWPYDEISLNVNEARDTVILKCPWLEAKIPVTESNKTNLQILAGKFVNKQLTAADIGLVQWFFKDLAKYPLCYVLPTAKSQGPLDTHTPKDNRSFEGGVENVLAAVIGQTDASGKTLTTEDVAQALTKVNRTSFEWDLDSALAFARIEDKIHPESIFSVIRRFHLIEVLENDRGKEAFQFIEGLAPEDYRRAVSIVVRQNHYVTQKCQESLAPAASIAGQARPQVEHFLKEENGHDLILNAAMKTLVENPEDLPVSTQTKTLMHLLKYAASRNFLAFAMVVDFFERSSYEKIDPLAQLLKKGGFEKAARQVNRHMEINDAGEHENVAAGFLEAMAPCSVEYAREAVRIAEAVSLVMNSVTGSAVDLYRNP